MRFFIPIVLVTFFVVPLFLPSQLTLSETTTVSSPQRQAYEALVDLNVWKGWSLWLLGENKEALEVKGLPGVVGQEIQGQGPGKLQGRMVLTALEEPRWIEVKTQVQAFWPSEMTVKLEVLSENNPQESQLKLSAQAPLSYPLQRYMGLAQKKDLQKQLSESLSRLKWWFEKEKES